ncbi:hypothetical protein [Ottowia massiliensis]|uniref:hypothetical protein n=1 Tax=Ottowia massiliensis TaxID=2045302 RepID=UPI0011AED6CB|nr:hypothetical protein [Ottowia massiliensis]
MIKPGLPCFFVFPGLTAGSNIPEICQVRPCDVCMDYLYTALKNLLPLLFHPRCPWQTKKQLADALQDGSGKA